MDQTEKTRSIKPLTYISSSKKEETQFSLEPGKQRRKECRDVVR